MAQISILYKNLEIVCMYCGVYRVDEFTYATWIFKATEFLGKNNTKLHWINEWMNEFIRLTEITQSVKQEHRGTITACA